MDKYILETDGSYSHDIDVGGIGGVLYKNGQIIDVYSLAFKNIKNEHESLSILYGLMLAKKYGAQDLTVKTDSLNHVVLFKSNYQAYIDKQTEENYKTQSLKIAKSFESFIICFQKREDNRTADKLSTLYKNNGYISISEPIEDLGMLPHDLFLSNKNHTSGDFRGITMFDISFFSQNKSTPKIFLNTIHYDKETNQFEIKTQEAVNDLGKISAMIYENLKITPGHSMVINGHSANIIRQTLAKNKGVTKNLHAAFLSLSENLSKNAVVVNSDKKTKYEASAIEQAMPEKRLT